MGQLAAANKELSHLANLDPLTGIANRRRFMEYLTMEWQREMRSTGTIAVVMIDVDFSENIQAGVEALEIPHTGSVTGCVSGSISTSGSIPASRARMAPFPFLLFHFSFLIFTFLFCLSPSMSQVEGSGCYLCPDLETCRVCPINAAYDTGSLGEISCQKCQLIKIEKTFKDVLLFTALGKV